PPASGRAAGGRHSCALLRDGTVQCWGGNDNGELGDGTTTPHAFPEPVSGVRGVVDVACRFDHACALTAAGTVWCWGANTYGQLGDGTTADRATPAAVSGLPPARSIATGYNHSCAVLE